MNANLDKTPAIIVTIIIWIYFLICLGFNSSALNTVIEGGIPRHWDTAHLVSYLVTAIAIYTIVVLVFIIGGCIMLCSEVGDLFFEKIENNSEGKESVCGRICAYTKAILVCVCVILGFITTIAFVIWTFIWLDVFPSTVEPLSPDLIGAIVVNTITVIAYIIIVAMAICSTYCSKSYIVK